MVPKHVADCGLDTIDTFKVILDNLCVAIIDEIHIVIRSAFEDVRSAAAAEGIVPRTALQMIDRSVSIDGVRCVGPNDIAQLCP